MPDYVIYTNKIMQCLIMVTQLWTTMKNVNNNGCGRLYQLKKITQSFSQYRQWFITQGRHSGLTSAHALQFLIWANTYIGKVQSKFYGCPSYSLSSITMNKIVSHPSIIIEPMFKQEWNSILQFSVLKRVHCNFSCLTRLNVHLLQMQIYFCHSFIIEGALHCLDHKYHFNKTNQE